MRNRNTAKGSILLTTVKIVPTAYPFDSRTFRDNYMSLDGRKSRMHVAAPLKPPPQKTPIGSLAGNPQQGSCLLIVPPLAGSYSKKSSLLGSPKLLNFFLGASQHVQIGLNDNSTQFLSVRILLSKILVLRNFKKPGFFNIPGALRRGGA